MVYFVLNKYTKPNFSKAALNLPGVFWTSKCIRNVSWEKMLIFGMNFTIEISSLARLKLLPVKAALGIFWFCVLCFGFLFGCCCLRCFLSKRKKCNTESEDYRASDISKKSLCLHFVHQFCSSRWPKVNPKLGHRFLCSGYTSTLFILAKAVPFPGHLLPPHPALSCCCAMVHLKINNFIKTSYFETLSLYL